MVSWFKVPLAQVLEVHGTDGFNLKDVSGNRQRQSCPSLLKEVGHWPGGISSAGIVVLILSCKGFCRWPLAYRMDKIYVTGVSVDSLNTSVVIPLTEYVPMDKHRSGSERQLVQFLQCSSGILLEMSLSALSFLSPDPFECAWGQQIQKDTCR